MVLSRAGRTVTVSAALARGAMELQRIAIKMIVRGIIVAFPFD
jgi:hypothetical protein